MGTLRIEDLWWKDAYDDSGRRLGRIEAVGMGRDRVPRRAGVRTDEGMGPLTFVALSGAKHAGDRIILPRVPLLPSLAHGSG